MATNRNLAAALLGAASDPARADAMAGATRDQRNPLSAARKRLECWAAEHSETRAADHCARARVRVTSSLREESDDWPRVLASFNRLHRVIPCRHGIRRIDQRRRGARHGRPRWEGLRYFRSRAALLAFLHSLDERMDPAALAALALLPEMFRGGDHG